MKFCFYTVIPCIVFKQTDTLNGIIYVETTEYFARLEFLKKRMKTKFRLLNEGICMCVCEIEQFVPLCNMIIAHLRTFVNNIDLNCHFLFISVKIIKIDMIWDGEFLSQSWLHIPIELWLHHTPPYKRKNNNKKKPKINSSQWTKAKWEWYAVYEWSTQEYGNGVYFVVFHMPTFAKIILFKWNRLI